jgi:hypothetical protein
MSDNDTWADEVLMAYVDGELEPVQRDQLERALADDAALGARVTALRSQRRRVEAAYATVLDEAVPDALAALLAGTPSGRGASVTPIEAARASRRGRSGAWGWAQWGGMAASLVLGLLLGVRWAGGGDNDSDAIELRAGRLVADGAIGQALTTQLAGTGGESSSASAVTVQLSFVDRDGAYCRTFSTSAIAGLACRQNGDWAVHTVTAAAASAPADGAVRQAASALPRAVLDAVDQRIAGEALDAARERAARERGWQR